MRLIVSVIVFLLFTNLSNAQEECIFDTKNQEKVLTKLQKKYRASKLTKNQNTLEVTWDRGIIRYQRGGCDHFGENIKYLTSDNLDFSNKSILFAQVTKMAKEFFRDLISGDELEEILKKGKYSLSRKIEYGDQYSIPHDRVLDLFILYSRTGEYHTIEVGYYIN